MSIFLRTFSQSTPWRNCQMIFLDFRSQSLGSPVVATALDKLKKQSAYATKGVMDKVEYGNGQKVQYTYDSFSRVTGVKFDSETANRFTYGYDAPGAEMSAAGGG